MHQSFTDQIGRLIDVPISPQRIVSLCPSLTETLYALGLGDKVVGRTRFCVHPADQVKAATRVGGTKDIHFDRLHQLQPDLIIAEKEENTQAMVNQLAADYPVWVGDVRDIPQALEMIEALGRISGAEEKARELVLRIQAEWAAIPLLPAHPTVIYLIWQDPFMAVGQDTFIDAVLTRLGFHNLIRQDTPGRYPSLSIDQLSALAPDHLFLSSEPYPFAEKHVAFFQKHSPKSKISVVDGEMFSWYGSRMALASTYFKDLLRALG